MHYQFIIIPIISAFIGYFTNVVAIKLLFWPRKPINFYLFTLYGLLPKNRNKLASSAGNLVEQELLSLDDVLDKINTPEVYELIISKISELLKTKLVETLPNMLPGRLVQLIADALEKLLRQEAPNLIKQLFASGQEYLSSEIKVSQIVEDKINDFDLDELENMVRGISSGELRFIEIMGGVLGLIIGIIQVLFLWLFPI